METRITKLLGIQYPILLGGLQWIGRAEFVAAVAEAGGTGFLSATTFGAVEELVGEINRTRALTAKPFGVNISMLPEMGDGDQSLALARAVIGEGIPFVETSGRSPSHLIPIFREAGVKVIHKVTAPKHALRAQNDGVDAVVLVGCEGGGHPGMDQVGTFVNLPAAADALKIPVITAGGICDGRGLAAALALGAEGIMMGTRWVATKECPVHDNFKQWIVNARTTDTMIIQRSIRNALRAVNNKKAQEVLGMEQQGAGLQELLPHISGQEGRRALLTGDTENAVLTAGQCAGRIGEILSVRAVMEGMIKEYQETKNRLATM